MDKHRLIVDSVVVRFGEKTVLTGGYITSETRMVTGLLGRNGAGKSCMFRALMGGLRVENVMVSIDEKPVNRQIIGHSIKYLPQGRLIPDGMKLHRAFDLYGVNYWTFVNRFPKFSRHYDSPIYELSPAAKPAWPNCIWCYTAMLPSTFWTSPLRRLTP